MEVLAGETPSQRAITVCTSLATALSCAALSDEVGVPRLLMLEAEERSRVAAL